jgi:hypothetical protein
METIGHTIDAAVRVTSREGGGGLHVPPVLQSWPGIVHGGAVVALLDAAATRLGVAAGPRLLEGRLTSSLPLATDLGFDVEPWQDGLTLTVRGGDQVLSSGTFQPLATPTPTGAPLPPAGAPLPPIGGPWMGGDDGAPLPASDDCLACGARNALGLRAESRFDDVGVWVRLTPGPAWRAGGAVHHAVAPILLDEIAWWIGAHVAGAGGLTNRITVTLLTPSMPAGVPLVAAGRFADVTPIDKRRTFWRTETALTTADGTPCATASIVFRGGEAYSSRQLPYFRARTSPAIFRRMFPLHAD